MKSVHNFLRRLRLVLYLFGRDDYEIISFNRFMTESAKVRRTFVDLAMTADNIYIAGQKNGEYINGWECKSEEELDRLMRLRR